MGRSGVEPCRVARGLHSARLRGAPALVAASVVLAVVAASLVAVLSSGSGSSPRGPGTPAGSSAALSQDRSGPSNGRPQARPEGLPAGGYASSWFGGDRARDGEPGGVGTGPGSSGAGVAPGTPVPNPSVRGPVTGGLRGRPYDQSVIDLAAAGYREQEFFLSGTAKGYGGATVFGQSPSGHAPDATSARYATRILVRRPADPRKFNGTVLFEWLNVTSGVSLDLDWATGQREIVRDGFAWVGVDAQAVGIETVRSWDPVRYGSLTQPGDQYSYDIFSQAVQAVRHPGPVDPLGGLGPVSVALADGHSQSGTYLHNYVDAVQNQARVVDGFLIRGDGNPVFALGQLAVPVFQYMSETEVAGFTGLADPSGAPPPADSRYYHLWQVAGAAHQDNWENTYLEDQLARDWAGAHRPWDGRAAGDYGEETSPVGSCVYAVNAGVGSPDATSVGSLDEFPQYYAVDAAIYYLNRWVRTGAPPPQAPRFATSSPKSIVRDQYGNAAGGVRLPPVDVPVATYDGVRGCPLTGVSFPLSAATLARLYPTHAGYVSAMRQAITRSQASGYLLPFDADDLLARAQAAPVGR